jgi:hypothetical protein
MNWSILNRLDRAVSVRTSFLLEFFVKFVCGATFVSNNCCRVWFVLGHVYRGKVRGKEVAIKKLKGQDLSEEVRL